MLGAGREGQELISLWLEKLPETDLTVIDENPQAQAPDGVHLIVEDFDSVGLNQFDVLIKSPGISLYRRCIQDALAHGVVVTSLTNIWFAENQHRKVIAVTGSKGKSTTAALIEFLLREAGVHVGLGGNIGVPLFQISKQAEIVVAELSSYQTSDLSFAPEVAVLTNLFPEHLDWHGSIHQYYLDKLKLFSFPETIKILPVAVRDSLPQIPAGDLRWVGGRHGWEVRDDQAKNHTTGLASNFKWKLRGQHNQHNLELALTAVTAVGASVAEGLNNLQAFNPLPHRLEAVCQDCPGQWVNDSLSTTPHATIAAIKALDTRDLIVIVGGQDRGVDWTCFWDFLSDWPIRAVLAVGEHGEKVVGQCADIGSTIAVHKVPDQDTAVATAISLSQPETTVVLSPGAPSYGKFKNYVERAANFQESIKRWSSRS